jgi:hypothetical protein
MCECGAIPSCKVTLNLRKGTREMKRVVIWGTIISLTLALAVAIATAGNSRRTYQLRPGDTVVAGATGWKCVLFPGPPPYLLCHSEGFAHSAHALDAAMTTKAVVVGRCKGDNCKVILKAHE